MNKSDVQELDEIGKQFDALSSKVDKFDRDLANLTRA